MRHMSFTLTPQQMRDGTKTVTRRHPDAWATLKPGDSVQPVLRTQGLHSGERHEFLCPPIEIVSNRIRSTSSITAEEVISEGFPELTVAEFVDLLERLNAVALMGVQRPDGPKVIKVTRRIEFRHTAKEQS